MSTSTISKKVGARSCGALQGASRVPLRIHAVATPYPGPSSHSRPANFPSVLGRNLRCGEECPMYTDNNGKLIKAMPADYGFRSGSGRLYEDHYGEVPAGFWDLAGQNFKQELYQMRCFYRFNTYQDIYDKQPMQQVGSFIASLVGRLDEGLENAGVLPKLEPPAMLSEEDIKEFDVIRDKLNILTLDVAGVARREAQRVEKYGDMKSPAWVKGPFDALCWVLDVMYENRPIPKFWVLESVARIPYFASNSVLHMYESLGFWRAGAELRKIHFAEEWNEMHHLQIMETLGGDQAWFDRFVAEHAGVGYYWLLIVFYLLSPKHAYNFMQRVENHAADTYTEFLEANREILATIPPPQVALNYYRNEDLYLFDEFQSGNKESVQRRPECNNLLDVFTNIRDDEMEHVKTMAACQTEGGTRKLIAGAKHTRDN